MKKETISILSNEIRVCNGMKKGNLDSNCVHEETDFGKNLNEVLESNSNVSKIRDHTNQTAKQ